MNQVLNESKVLFEYKHKDRVSKQHIILTEDNLFIKGAVKHSLLVKGKGTKFISTKWIMGALKTEVSNFAWLLVTILAGIIAIYTFSISTDLIFTVIPLSVAIIFLILYFILKQKVLIINTINENITLPTKKLRKKELDDFFYILEDLLKRIQF